MGNDAHQKDEEVHGQLPKRTQRKAKFTVERRMGRRLVDGWTDRQQTVREQGQYECKKEQLSQSTSTLYSMVWP